MKPRIQPPGPDETPEASKPLLAAVKAQLGVVPNLHRTLAHAPAALQAYIGFAQALGSGALSPQLREQVAVAVAGANGCSYCASAHTTLGLRAKLTKDELRENVEGRSADTRVATLLDFSRKLTLEMGAIEDTDLSELRRHDFSDPEIVEVAAHVGLNMFTNMFNLMARTENDFPEVAVCRRAR